MLHADVINKYYFLKLNIFDKFLQKKIEKGKGGQLLLSFQYLKGN